MKIVITGGPCTGKTTTIESLKKRGHAVVDEASRMLIEEQNKTGGDLVPWKKLREFNSAVAELQLKLESQAPEGLNFLDRGVIDNLAYCEWGGIEPPKKLKQAAEKSKYDKVFLLLPLPIHENDDVRKESREDVLKLTGLIKKAYHETGHEVIEVPVLPVEERTDFILQNISATSD